MPTYTYTGDEDRYYTTLALTPEPGGEYELDHNPGDGRWTPEDPEPEPPVEAATGALDVTGETPPDAEHADPGPRAASPRARMRTTKSKEA